MLLLTLLGAATILIGQLAVDASCKGKIYSSVADIPTNEVGLVLGCSKHTSKGYTNLYFKYRMQAAADLYKAGKVKHLLVSGDNHTKSYDEATDMRDFLVALGVPASAITLDYAGFRTLDSVVRSKEVFGQNSITIVSQEFHSERALFLAQSHGIEAVALNAQDVPKNYHRVSKTREVLARAKALLDVYVLHTEPRFLGDPEPIRI